MTDADIRIAWRIEGRIYERIRERIGVRIANRIDGRLEGRIYTSIKKGEHTWRREQQSQAPRLHRVTSS